MSEGGLLIGTRRYSSWSLRGWLSVRLAELDVEETVIALASGPTPAVKAATPSGTVPYLEHRGAQIWESLAIAEDCAEFAPSLWPAEVAARAHARAISAEMHAGFFPLREAMPMSLFRSGAGGGRTPGALADIARIAGHLVGSPVHLRGAVPVRRGVRQRGRDVRPGGLPLP